MKKTKSPASPALPGVKDWHAIAVIALLTAFFFRDILLNNAFFWEDFLYQFYPFRNFAAVSIANGELPLWNPYTFSGTPFQADIQSALFYLPNLLLTLFVSGDRLSYYWVEVLVIAHFMLAGIFMYYLAKDFGLHRIIALFSGIVYALSGFMIAHAIHLVMVSQVAWLPLILLLFRRSLQRNSLLYMILAGLVLGHAILAGFPQLSLYIFLFLFLYFLFEFSCTIKEKGIKSSLRLVPIAGGMIIVSLALTAVQLLPTVELAPLSQRAEISYEKSMEGMLSWSQLITIFIPKYFGTSGAQGSTYFGPGQYWAFWESCFYIGIPGLICVLISSLLIGQNRYIAFFFGVTIFSLLYALGDNFIIHKFFFNTVPGFDKFRSIGRMTVLLTFCGSLLSGFGLRAVVESARFPDNRYKRVILSIVALGIGFWIMAQSGLFLSPGNGRVIDRINPLSVRETTVALVLIIISAGAMIFLLKNKVTPFVAVTALLLIQFVDMNIFGFNQNNGSVDPEEYYNRTGTIVDMIRKESGKELFRINSRLGGSMILDRNQGMVDRIFMMEGYTPLSLQRIFPPAPTWDKVCDLLNAKYRVTVDENKRHLGLKSAVTQTPRAYFVNNALVIRNEEEIKAVMESESFDPLRTVLLEEDPEFPTSGSDNSAGGTVTVKSFRLNCITLEAFTRGNAFLVLSEIYYPGWTAYIDGERHKVYRANWSLRAVQVRSGNHRIELRFEPESFHRGKWITIATLLLSAVGIIYSLREKKNNHTSGSPKI